MDRWRRYEVRVDGASVGALRAGGTLTAHVTPGVHELRVHIDWCASPPLRFRAVAGECHVFRCGNALRGWRALFARSVALGRPGEYLWLEKAPADARIAGPDATA